MMSVNSIMILKTMKKIIFTGSIVVCIVALLGSTCMQREKDSSKETDPKKDGYVPNEETAIKVAEAIWLPIYGKDIYKEKPFHATLKNDSIWIVQGTLEKGADGGTVYAEIQKKDCKLLKVTHYK